MSTRDELVALDRRRLWHPYTPMGPYLEGPGPLVVARAEGARFWDLDGRCFLDGNSSWWVATLGHCHGRLVAALRRQSEELCHVSLAGITHEPAARLAEELCAVAPPGLERVFFSDDGSTAVEVAMKLAAQWWHNRGEPARRRFVALSGAFHGDTLGATSLGGVEVFRRPFAGLLVECVRLPPLPPAGEDETFTAAFAAVAELLGEAAGTVAAVVVEPLLQGAAGMRCHSPACLRTLRAQCDELGVLLIADEVFTGYGRTGTMWACEQAGVSPDILCTAKGFTGGTLPMAATLVSEPVFAGFLGDPSRAFWHGHSFCGNPLGAAVAREVLAVYRDERILERAVPKAARIARAFAALGALGHVSRARSIGMVGALDLASEGGYLGRGGWEVYEQALRRGAYLRPLGDTVYVAPPLNIPDADLDELLGIVGESVRAVGR